LQNVRAQNLAALGPLFQIGQQIFGAQGNLQQQKAGLLAGGANVGAQELARLAELRVAGGTRKTSGSSFNAGLATKSGGGG
jgi:hypothetical protein